MAHETGLGLLWLMGVLSADSTLAGYAPGGVARAMAPASTATPFVIVGYQAGHDVTTANAVRIMADVIYQVRASGPASQTAAIVNAAGRIDTLIDSKKNQTVTGGLVLSSSRDEPLEYDELVAGAQWSNFGGLYRLIIRSN
jgi:hypothetical protein